jgi:glycerol uptake facilitator-like aquaporin
VTGFCFDLNEKMDTKKMKTTRMYVGEFLATFIFLFAVCATSLNTPILNIPTIGPIAAGFAAFCVVFCFGGHFNTAVTIGAMVGKKMDVTTGMIYILIQLVASFAAIGAINLIFPGSTNADSLMVKPSSSSSNVAAVFMEFFLTFILVLVIFRSAMGVQVKPKIKSAESTTTAEGNSVDDIAAIVMEESRSPVETAKEYQSRVKAAETRKNHAPLVIGLTIGFLATMGGTVSGGAFNPLRPTAPAVFVLNFEYLWIYWVGDCLGGVTAGLVHYYIFEDN